MFGILKNTFHPSPCKSLLERATLPMESWLTSIEGHWVAHCISQTHTKLFRPLPHSSVSYVRIFQFFTFTSTPRYSNGLSFIDTGPSMGGTLGIIRIINSKIEFDQSNSKLKKIYTLEEVKKYTLKKSSGRTESVVVLSPVDSPSRISNPSTKFSQRENLLRCI